MNYKLPWNFLIINRCLITGTCIRLWGEVLLDYTKNGCEGHYKFVLKRFMELEESRSYQENSVYLAAFLLQWKPHGIQSIFLFLDFLPPSILIVTTERKISLMSAWMILGHVLTWNCFHYWIEITVRHWKKSYVSSASSLAFVCSLICVKCIRNNLY